jgi:hypothetical protein
MNITITQGHWSYTREARLRDALWLVPLILLSCGVC